MDVREALDALCVAAGQDPAEVRTVRAYVGPGVVEFLTSTEAVRVPLGEVSTPEAVEETDED